MVTVLQKSRAASIWNNLAWLFPVTYLLHIAEEYFGGFPARLLLTQNVSLSAERFLTLQSTGLVLMVVGILLAQQLRFPNQMFLLLATLVTSNTVVHTIRSIEFGGYDPGVLTGLFLWLPLGVVTFLTLSDTMRRFRILACVAIGVGISAAVELITII
jgi:hypothetical protein